MKFIRNEKETEPVNLGQKNIEGFYSFLDDWFVKLILICIEMKMLVEGYTDKFGLIMDAGCGVGTGGVACLALNRFYLAFDKDTVQVSQASKRVAAAAAALKSKVDSKKEKNPDTKKYVEDGFKGILLLFLYFLK